MFFLIYLPLDKALETSLINNFRQISIVNFYSLENNIQRGLEGARSLSSRTMIKRAIEEYKDGKISSDELMAYTQPKYEEGAKVLEYLMVAERSVDGLVIARYAPLENRVATDFLDRLLFKGAEMEAKIHIKDGLIYSVILSPVLSDDNILGYDKLVFDLTDYIRLLCAEVIETSLLSEEAFQAVISNAKIVRDDGEKLVFSKSGYYFVAARLQDDIHFISKQGRSTLFRCSGAGRPSIVHVKGRGQKQGEYIVSMKGF